MNKIFIYIFLLLLSHMSSAQIGDSLTFYADVMRHADLPEHRNWAAKHFKNHFVKSIEAGESFEESVLKRWVSILSSEDKSVVIYTWQVNGPEVPFYEGVLKTAEGGVQALQPTELEWATSEFDGFGVNDWPAALYYRIIPFGDNYILLGLNSSQQSVNVKVAETLALEDGEWTFGVPMFYMDTTEVRPTIKHRITVQYDKRSAGRMNFDESNHTLFFDHVIPMETMEGKDEVSWVPDGSYEGFVDINGRLVYRDKLFNQQVDTPPGQGKPKSVRKDVFGRPE